jgi:hypothetical protein
MNRHLLSLPYAVLRASARMRHLCPLFIIFLIIVVPAWPQSASPPTVIILSEGMTTCGEFTAQPEMQVVRMEWVLGYISGVNAGLSRTADAAPTERMAGRSFQQTATAIGWLQSYCYAHPLEVLATAAEQLRRDFIRHERR